MSLKKDAIMYVISSLFAFLGGVLFVCFMKHMTRVLYYKGIFFVYVMKEYNNMREKFYYN
jgi:hypothetical protein